MSKRLRNLLALLFIVAVSGAVSAKTETIRGRVVDQDCYMNDKVGNVGVDHKMPAVTTDNGGKDCAIECAKKGQPMALLTADGTLYTIIGGLAANNNVKLVPHISHMVEITGETTDVTNFDSKTDLTTRRTTIAAADLKMVSK